MTKTEFREFVGLLLGSKQKINSLEEEGVLDITEIIDGFQIENLR